MGLIYEVLVNNHSAYRVCALQAVSLCSVDGEVRATGGAEGEGGWGAQRLWDCECFV